MANRNQRPYFISGRFSLKKENLILGLVPLLLFFFMIFRLEEIHAFFQTWYDPVYAYLMNGLTFALGSNDIGHVDHPGTPLQLLIAILIRFFSLFRGNQDLAVDVLTHPESYLRFITVILILLNCAALWILGWFVYRMVGNRSMAMAIQLIPLTVFQLVNFMPVVNCETVISFVSTAIVSCFLIYEMKEQGRWVLVVVVAFLSAFMIATKISTAMMLVIPFIFFEKNKHRISYLFLTLIFAIIFILPVWEKLGNLTGFLEKIATHTGKYGGGEAKLFDASIYFHSIKEMMTKELTFSVHVLLMPAGWVIITKRRIKGFLFRLYLALTLGTLLQIIVVARHYSFHYLMPVFALTMPLHGIFWIEAFRYKIPVWPPRIVSLTVSFLVIIVFVRLVIRNHFASEIVNPIEKTTEAIERTLRGKYIVLTDFNNGAALIDPALRFGYSYCGPATKIKYAPVLKSVTRENFYWNSRDGFTNWQGTLLASDVFGITKKIYLYANASDCSVSRQKIDEMIRLTGMSDFLRLETVFRNDESGEIILEATADTEAVQRGVQPDFIVETSMEDRTSDHGYFKSNHPELDFRGGNLQSDLYARNGKYSILLTKSIKFGLDMQIPVSYGNRFKVEFWQRSSDENQLLVVAAAAKSDVFYKTSVQSRNSSEGWTKSELNVTLPGNYPDTLLLFYLYNPVSDSVWVDDFKLEIFK